MLSDLSVTTMTGAIVLVVLGALMMWVARSVQAGSLPLGGRLCIRTKATRTSREALLAGNQAAAPFLGRYGVIVLGCAVLGFLLAFVSDVAALGLYVIGLIFLALAYVVCTRKTDAAAGAVVVPTEA